MRILQVIEFATPAKGGSVEVARMTAAGLARRGHEVELWSSAYGHVPPIGGVRMCLFPGLDFSGLYLTPGILYTALAKMRAFDVVHLHNVRSIQNAVAGTAARRMGVPYVISLHGSLADNGVKAGPKRIFDLVVGTRLIRQAAALTTPSWLEGDRCRASGIDPARVHLAYNPIPAPETTPMRSEDLGAPVVGYLGRLDRSKGIDRLLAAFAHAHVRRPDLRLEIAGPDEGDGARLQALARDLGVQGAVAFRGALYGGEKWEYLTQCAVVASPCPFEIFGLATFEALAVGTPVVVAEGSGGARLVMESGAGLLIDPDDAATFGQALLAQLDTTTRVRDQARAFVGQVLSVDVYLDRIEDVYRKVLGEGVDHPLGSRAASGACDAPPRVGVA